VSRYFCVIKLNKSEFRTVMADEQLGAKLRTEKNQGNASLQFI
jgi:hypothetical protein